MGQGAQSGESATIYGFATVSASGYLAMASAVLDGASAPSSTVSVSGHLAGYGAHFLCRAGSSCALRCSGSGCLKLRFECEDGAECAVFPEQCAEGVEFAEATLCPEWATSMSASTSQSIDSDDAVLRYLKERREADRITRGMMDIDFDFERDDLHQFFVRTRTRNESAEGQRLQLNAVVGASLMFIRTRKSETFAYEPLL